MALNTDIQPFLDTAVKEETDVTEKSAELGTAQEEQTQAQTVLNEKKEAVDTISGQLDTEKTEYKAAIDALIEKLTEIRNSQLLYPSPSVIRSGGSLEFHPGLQ